MPPSLPEVRSRTAVGGHVHVLWLAIRRPAALARLAGGLLLVVTIVPGTQVSGLVQLVALVAGSLVILLVERTSVPGEI